MKHMKGGFWLSLLALFIALSKDVQAASIPSLINTGFRQVFTTLNNDYVLYGVTLLLFFLMLYAIILAAAKRIKVFQDGENLSKQGKVFAFALSGMATLGLFFTTYRSLHEIVYRVLGTMNVFGMIVFGLVVFLIVFYGFRQGDNVRPCAGLVATGLAFILPSMVMDYEGWYTFGWLLLIIGGIWCLFTMFSRGGNDGHGDHGDHGNHDDHHNDNNRRHNDRDDGGEGRRRRDPNGLDNTNPGRIRILVTNADDNPIPAARVRVYALGMPIWRRVLRRHTAEYMVLRGTTGPNGLWPSRPTGEVIGSGPVRIRVNSRFGDATAEALIAPNRGEVPQVIQVTLPRRGEREETFEPFIDNINPRDTEGRLLLNGVVR